MEVLIFFISFLSSVVGAVCGIHTPYQIHFSGLQGNGAGAALGDHAHRDGSGNGLFTLVIGVFLQCIVVVGNPFLYSEGTRSHDIVRIAVGLAGCCYGCFLYDT